MTKNTVIDDAKSMASTLRSVRMMRPAEAIEKLIEAYLAQEARIAELTKDAEPATTCPRIELVVAIHSLASDFENMSYSFGADTEDRKRAQGSIKHAMAVANKHNQNGAGCITHPPAPKAITADMVTDEMVKTWVIY